MNHRNALVIFARAPEPGQVKTRIAAELGAMAAVEIYRTLATRVISAALAGTSYRVTVAYSPRDGESVVRAWLGPSPALRPQCDGDLGARMACAVGDELARGAERVIVIGTDCPEVTPAVIEDAFARLERSDVVLGPAADGGYYLIGMSRLHRALFDDVPWSSPDTLRVTRERARASGLRVELLGELRDVDTASDWRAWLACRDRAGEPAG
ncbi:MAG: TIGR04282 family arsenosugar biosynthesis glycosyltransferase [Gemmatimonadaceae bacterium]